MSHWVYILKCADDSYYTGSTSNLQRRLREHQSGLVAGYTASRLPVTLMWSAEFPTEHEAFVNERKLKGWSRAKKEALIRDDWARVHQVVVEERRKRETGKRIQ